MIASANRDAADGADVAEIAAPADGDVAVAGEEVVGRVGIDPAELGAPDGEPRVRGVGAGEPHFAGGWNGFQIPADVARRQAERAEARNADVREILADATL